MNTLNEKKDAFERILKIMDELREQCPWDKEQTFASLRSLTIEETYELVAAIASNDMQGIKRELGDLFLHLIFYSKIASETNSFDIADVINALAEKLIYRHPHIYGNETVANKEEVKQNWEALKLKEKGGNTTILGGVPKSLPAMIKAMRIQEKARGAGFDWDKKEQVWAKVKEELEEFEAEVLANDSKKMEDEFGDVLFSLINAARLYNIDPETALEKTNRKFIARFNYLEEQVKKADKNLQDMDLEQMEFYWNKAKKAGL